MNSEQLLDTAQRLDFNSCACDSDYSWTNSSWDAGAQYLSNDGSTIKIRLRLQKFHLYRNEVVFSLMFAAGEFICDPYFVWGHLC